MHKLTAEVIYALAIYCRIYLRARNRPTRAEVSVRLRADGYGWRYDFNALHSQWTTRSRAPPLALGDIMRWAPTVWRPIVKIQDKVWSISAEAAANVSERKLFATERAIRERNICLN